MDPAKQKANEEAQDTSEETDAQNRRNNKAVDSSSELNQSQSSTKEQENDKRLGLSDYFKTVKSVMTDSEERKSFKVFLRQLFSNK